MKMFIKEISLVLLFIAAGLIPAYVFVAFNPKVVDLEERILLLERRALIEQLEPTKEKLDDLKLQLLVFDMISKLAAKHGIDSAIELMEE